MHLAKFVIVIVLTSAFVFDGADCQFGQLREIRSISEWNRNLQKANGTLVVAQFYIPWCPYCRVMKPEYEKIARQNGDVIFLNVNANDQQNLAWQMGLRSVPTYKFLKNRSVVDSITTWNPDTITDLVLRLK